MNNNKSRTAAFTGHRMNRISIEETELSTLLSSAIVHSYLNGYRFFLSGMAEGTDLLAAEEVLRIKEFCPDVELHCIIPFRGQPERMSVKNKSRYDRILSGADDEICLSERYYNGCFFRRNDYLIDNSTQLIAYYDHVPQGGTYYTVKNAQARGHEVINLFGRELEYHHFYQDELLTGWGRTSFNIKATSYEQAEEFLRLLNFKDVYEFEDHPLIAYDSFDYMLETNTRMNLEKNEGHATVEYLKKDSMKMPIFSNADNVIAEARLNTLKELAAQLAEKKMTDVFKVLPDIYRDKSDSEKYGEAYRKRYDEYFKSYMEQLSNL